MIKGLTVVKPVASVAAWERIGALFAELGFESGKGWDDGAGKGAAFLAPLGNAEFVTGRLPAVPELLFEVTSLDVVYGVVKRWLAAEVRSEEMAQRLSEIEATHWKSRMFVLDLGGEPTSQTRDVGHRASAALRSAQDDDEAGSPSTGSGQASASLRSGRNDGSVGASGTADPSASLRDDRSLGTSETAGSSTPLRSAQDDDSVGASTLRFGFWERDDVFGGRPIAVEGDLSAAGMRFGIVVARWNAVITDRLLQGSLDAVVRSGGAQRDIDIVRVPGAWEVPAAARMMADLKDADGKRKYDAIITLGCLLRGETAHYEAIYNEAARGIGQSQQDTGLPHAFGVLTCETLEQALNRAGVKAGNKGFEAAVAAIEMVSLARKIGHAAAGEHEGSGVVAAKQADAVVTAALQESL